MKKIDRSEILDLGPYEEIRERFRARLIEAKKHRRLSVGAHMTLIFENRDTVLFQIQEMLRTERITSGSAIQHEIDTYNELIPEAGELSATLMIEYDDPAERRVALDHFASLRKEMFIDLEGHSVLAQFRDQPGEEPDRLPAVNYVRFKVGDVASVFEDETTAITIRVANAHYQAETNLSKALRRELAADLREP